MFAHEQSANSLEHAAELSRTRYYWYIYGGNDYTNFNFDMIPPSWEWNHVYVWPSQWQRNGNVYLACKWEHGPLHYMEDQRVKSKITCDIFMVDQFNKNNKVSLESVHKQDSGVRKIRGVGNWASIIKKACETSTCDFVWVVSSDYDYSNFDFGWYPETWQSNMIHVFGSRYQKWANVFRVPRHEFLRLSQWFTDIKQFPELNFVSDQSVELFDDNREIWYIDHSNEHSFEQQLDHKTVRFFDSYLETIKRICARTENDYVWVTSSVCDYTNFDFGWEPEPWQQNMLHVFASEDQKFGDTFYVPVKKFLEQAQDIELLDWFDTVNYMDISVPRHKFETVVYSDIDLPTAVSKHDFKGPYTLFKRHTASVIDNYNPSVWRKKDRAVHALSHSGSVTLVPKDAKTHVKDQMYDYPYVDHHSLVQDQKLDVIFISNGEKLATKNLDQLKKFVPNAKHINGINGRTAAYNAAAQASETDWFFAVFSKCWVHEDFDWNWQPDRLIGDQHYIFNAYNPVNDLSYGHMAVIAYNKRAVLSTKDIGLDFTLSARHTSVPLLSCTAIYDESPYATWRTAFREVIKLKSSQDIASRSRLTQWLLVGKGQYGKWSIQGANDAIEFYDSVNGDIDQLKKSYDWQFCEEFFNTVTD